MQRHYTLFMYARPETINYTSSCTLIACGRRVWIDTLNGRDFCPLLAEVGLQPFAQFGLQAVEIDVKDLHLQRLVASLGHLNSLRRLRLVQIADIPLNRIEIWERKAP